MKKSTLFRVLKEVGAFHAYQMNMNTGKFRWDEDHSGREFWFEIYLSLRDLCLKRGEVVD